MAHGGGATIDPVEYNYEKILKTHTFLKTEDASVKKKFGTRRTLDLVG
jgi:hypothetical protein